MIVQEVMDILKNCSPTAEVILVLESCILYTKECDSVIERETIDHKTNQVHRQVIIGSLKNTSQKNRIELGVADR